MGFLTSNYESKQSWRGEIGLLSMSPRATRAKGFNNTFKSKATITNEFGSSIKTLNIRHPQNSNIEFF